MLTATRAFDAKTISLISDEKRKIPAPSVHKLRAEIPIGVDHVIARSLATDPNARYQNATELVNAFKKAIVNFDDPTTVDEPLWQKHLKVAQYEGCEFFDPLKMKERPVEKVSTVFP